MCGLVFEDLIAQDGLNKVKKMNVKKAQIVYDTIDRSKGFFRCPVEKSVRSLMNGPLTLAKLKLEAGFVKEAAKEKMVQLKGHMSIEAWELQYAMLCLWLGLREKNNWFWFGILEPPLCHLPHRSR
ncbi:unnamed protein product [Fraxinus pennsylvanica]|uniref:Uncharacterized protein n=1 Tax=Fraxinus pennsylvanica TaxID=56036 RepID=A0AAD1ZRL1_9LAMI|nr:unnamed protein product [Fraxinus pennsylvanica]